MSDWETLGIALKLIGYTGLHPLKVSKLLFIFNLAMLSCITVLVITNMLVNFHFFQLEASSYVYYVWIKFVAISLLKRTPLRKMLSMINKFKPNDFSSEENETYRTYIRRLKIYAAYLIVFCSFFVVGSSLTKDIPTVFDPYLPKGVPRRVLYFSELYVVVSASFSISGNGILATTLLLSVAQQFKLLNNKMKTFDLRQMQMEDTRQMCKKRLKEIITYHIFLLKCVKLLNEIYSLPLFLQLGGDIYLLSVNIYGISSPASTRMDLFRSAAIAVEISVSFIFLFGYPSQLLMEMAEEFGNSIYCHCDWYIPNIVPVRKDLLFMIARSQKSLRITAGGLVNVNNATVLLLLKTAYSFYTYLQTIS
nr:odorant receptor [Semanotus bifasciatus]